MLGGACSAAGTGALHGVKMGSHWGLMVSHSGQRSEQICAGQDAEIASSWRKSECSDGKSQGLGSPQAP